MTSTLKLYADWLASFTWTFDDWVQALRRLAAGATEVSGDGARAALARQVARRLDAMIVDEAMGARSGRNLRRRFADEIAHDLRALATSRPDVTDDDLARVDRDLVRMGALQPWKLAERARDRAAGRDPDAVHWRPDPVAAWCERHLRVLTFGQAAWTWAVLAVVWSLSWRALWGAPLTGLAAPAGLAALLAGTTAATLLIDRVIAYAETNRDAT